MAGAPRAAIRFTFRGFISIDRTIARGVTAMVVALTPCSAIGLFARQSPSRKSKSYRSRPLTLFFLKCSSHARRGTPPSSSAEAALALGCSIRCCSQLLSSGPNVKDEPRRELARRVQHYISLSVVSLRNSFGRTRRDRSRRWLWRLVGRLGRLSHEETIQRSSNAS